MSIEQGMKYQISNDFKSRFNSAESLTVIRQVGNTIQFNLENGKGYGSMPVDHLNYLLKESKLTINRANRVFINQGDEEQIG